MEQWLWKIAQIAVFSGLVVFFYEVGDREISMLAAMILALGVTALIFAPFLHLKAWLEGRRVRKDATRGHRPHNRRSPGARLGADPVS